MVSSARRTGPTGRADRERNRGQVSIRRIAALGGMDLVQARFRNWTSHRHSHPEVEVGVVVTGQRQVEYRGRRFRASAGSILVFNPGEIHAGSPLDHRGSSYRAFLIPRGGLAAACGSAALGSMEQGLASSDAPMVRDPILARRLVLTHRALGGPGHDTRHAEALVRVLHDLLRHHGGTAGPESARSLEPEAVLRVRAYLDTHFRSKIQLAALAELAGLNVFRLIRVFREATGLPPYAYLEQLRVDRAGALLRQGVPVSEVAFQTGFADQSHLTRLFKRLVGVPPGRYRLSALEADLAGSRRN